MKLFIYFFHARVDTASAVENDTHPRTANSTESSWTGLNTAFWTAWFNNPKCLRPSNCLFKELSTAWNYRNTLWGTFSATSSVTRLNFKFPFEQFFNILGGSFTCAISAFLEREVVAGVLALPGIANRSERLYYLNASACASTAEVRGVS